MKNNQISPIDREDHTKSVNDKYMNRSHMSMRYRCTFHIGHRESDKQTNSVLDTDLNQPFKVLRQK